VLVMLSTLRGVVLEQDRNATHAVFLQFTILRNGVLQRVELVLVVAMTGPMCCLLQTETRGSDNSE